ncbi:MAG: EAL domain-containing protein [Alphaproteobacteria bacterium]
MRSWQKLAARPDSAMGRFLVQREHIGARRNADLAVASAARVRDVEALMASVFATSQDGILIVGADNLVAVANAAADALIGRPWLAAGDCRIERLIPDIDLATRDGRYREGLLAHADGRALPIEYAVTSVCGEDSTNHVIVLRDISERKRHEGTLRHQATHDPLTGLPNRTLLTETVEARLAAADGAGSRFALLLLDLDRFKEINDTLGHDIGDDLLCRLADRLRLQDPQFGFVSRLGGDEFALLIDPVPDQQTAQQVAEALAARIEEPFMLRDLSLGVEASIGVALFPDHAGSMKDLLRCADVAMYEAKQRRTRFATYDSHVDRNSIRHLTLTGELKRAVEDNEMRLEYQPKLCLAGFRPFTAEALLRWHHPTLGKVSPTEFIPQAEQTGLIGALTINTLGTAIRQMADWEKRGLAMSVAVNLSAQVIHDRNLPKMVDDLLCQHALAPGRLTLELTESAIMHDPEGALQVAHEVAEIGVRLSIDDFGTGYSSLAYLSRLPVRELKIDRSFVSRMLGSPTDATIVRSTIDLAHSLGMEVVGEGIDQIEILHRLVALGCDYGQGFLIARPTVPTELSRVVLDAVRRAHREWGIGTGGDAPDVRALQATAAAELIRAAAAAVGE